MPTELSHQAPCRRAALPDSFSLSSIESRNRVFGKSLPEHRQEQFLGLSLQDGLCPAESGYTGRKRRRATLVPCREESSSILGTTESGLLLEG